MTSDLARRVLPAAFLASLAFASPAAAEERVKVSEGVQFTLSGAQLTIVATDKASRFTRRQLGKDTLQAICLSGLPPEYAQQVSSDGESSMPEGGFEFTTVGNLTERVGSHAHSTSFKRDISATVDICGVEEPGGSDVAYVAFTEHGENLIHGAVGDENEEHGEMHTLRAAFTVAQNKQSADGRYPTPRRLQRAIARSTDYQVKRARRLSGVKRPGVVYIVGKTGKQVKLAMRLRDGSLVGLKSSRRHGIIEFGRGSGHTR